ncbi:MAG: hypothetical protein VX724_05305 [Chloroflexota bacterium]|nr:hypothetical protein [Chloroflexota bacterium]
MAKSLTKLEFQQELQTNVEFIAETRVSKLMALPIPDFEVTHSDLEEKTDGKIYLSSDRLRSYIGLVSAELLALFDEILVDIIFQESEASEAQ